MPPQLCSCNCFKSNLFDRLNSEDVFKTGLKGCCYGGCHGRLTWRVRFLLLAVCRRKAASHFKEPPLRRNWLKHHFIL